VRAWFHTYGLPVLTTNCSNNYGPYHFPEKLIPLMIVNALAGKPLPIYGDGLQVRDWLYVADHCSAIRAVLEAAAARARSTTSAAGTRRPTARSCTPSARCSTNCAPTRGPYTRLITHVKDRPGHDRRYAIDARKIERELGWRPGRDLRHRHPQDRAWYLDHADWVAACRAALPRLGRRQLRR
jgi:dTDP-glucose 4,6-dehydratase